MAASMLQDIRTITSLSDYLGIMIPAAPSLPADEAEANLYVGQLAHYLTLILASYEGFAPLRIPYHMGQGNEAVMGLLQACLEVNPDAGNFEIIEPIPGASYAPGANTISLRILTGAALRMSCTIYAPSGGYLIDSSAWSAIEANVWLAEVEYEEPGEHTLSFTVRYTSGTVQTREVTTTVESV